MDTKKERCVFIFCALKRIIDISDITNLILDRYSDFTSQLTILIDQKMESLCVNLCRTSLTELKLFISNNFMNGKKIDSLSAQYWDINKNNRSKKTCY